MDKKHCTLLLFCLVFAACSTAQRPSVPSKITTTIIRTPAPPIRVTTTTDKKPTVVFPSETGDFRADMLTAVNFVRSKGCRCGGQLMPPVPPLTWNSLLEGAAIRHAKDMAVHKHFDHVGTDGSEIDSRVTDTGYKWMQIGENIAWNYNTIAEAMAGWIISPSHCFQLMSNKVNEMGAAKNGKYWVQDFGKVRNW